MYPISSSLRQRFERGEKKSVLITLKNHQYDADDAFEITEADIISNSLSIDRYCITGNKIEIGSAVSAELSLAINNNSGKFDDVAFEGSELFVKIGIAGVSNSYVPCGKFTVDEPPRNKRRINIKALDFMMLFDNTADVKNLSFETPEKLVKGICTKCYVTLSNNVNFSNFANTSKELIAPTTEVTYRQLLQWVCQILGVCAYFDGNGELMLSWYTDAKDTSGDKIKIDTTTRYSGDAYENDIKITGVVIKTADKDIKSGTATNALIIENNQLLDSADTKLSDVAGNIWNKVKDFKYRPYECSCMPMPYIFPLDKIVYKDQNGSEINTIVTHHNFGLNGASALAAKGETEQQRGYAKSKGVTKDEINAAIAEAMKGVDLKTDHFHVKYSAYPDGKDPDTGEASMTDEPKANSVYIGTCVTDSASVPGSPEDYNWIKIKGEDGKTPIKDVDYFDGATLQVKYKSSSTKPTISNNNVSGWVDTMPAPSAGQRVYMAQKLSTETNWSTPIQISAEDGTTPTITITSDGYWKINDDKTTVKAEGTPGNTPTIKVGANGNWYVDDKDTGTKAQGAQGKDGANIEYIYYRKTALGTPTTPTASTVIYTPTSTTYNKWTSSPCGITETYKYEYVSVRTKAAGSSTWSTFSTPVIWSKWGEKGTDGDGVEYKYYLSNSADKPTYSASSTSWKDDPTGVSEDNMYEYVVQITHHGDGTSTTSGVALWAKWGEQGIKGNSLQVKYKNSATAPTITNNNVSGWSDTVPTPETGKKTYMTQKLSNETNWSTPIQISGADGTTPTVSISTDGYWIINGEKTSTKAKGEKPTITVGPNGNWYVDGTDSGTKAQGEQGKDGADIEYVYYRSQTAKSLSAPSYTGSTLTTGWTKSPQGITETYKYEYVSVRKKTAGSSSWGAFSTPIIWSKWGEKGADGDGIEYKYYLKNNSTKPSYSASDTKWTDEPTGVSASNMYEYVVQITHHGNGTTTISAVSLWAKWGEKGTNGRTVVSITTQYHLSTSNTTAPSQTSSSWSTDIPEWLPNTYLWQREVTVFDNPTEVVNGTPILDKSWDALGAAVNGHSVLTQATEDLNAALAGSLGLHKYEDDDGKIYYHNGSTKNDIASSSVIFGFGSNGFGVAHGWNNGSPDYEFGITDTGNAVWNILTAHKISADLIEAGEIKSADGAPLRTSFDLDSGLVTMKSNAGKESFGFGLNNNNHLMLQYNYSDTSKLGVVMCFYYNGVAYKDFGHTEAYTPSMDYYYVDVLYNRVYKWSGTAYVRITNADSEHSTVLDSNKGFAMHAYGKTVGYEIAADGTVTSDYNATRNNWYGFETPDNAVSKTPIFKFYDPTREALGSESHLTALRRESIVTKYMGAENYAVPVSGTLFDLGKLIEGIVEQIQGVVLYDAITQDVENNGANRDADVPLNQDVSQFSYIEIYFADRNGFEGGYTKVYSPWTKTIELSMIEAGGQTISYIRRSMYYVDKFKLTPHVANSVNPNQSVTTVQGSTIKCVAEDHSHLFITRVVGYKDHNIIAQPHTCNSFVAEVTSKVLPTCTEAGYEVTTYSCSICGKVQTTETSTLDATNHIDLDNDGKCDNCGSSDISHTHRYTSVITPPTATAQGYTTYTCNCGYSYKDNYTNPTGCSHSSTAVRYETTKNATCTTAGSRNKITYCTSCNAVISSVPETIPTTAHNYVNGTCSVCGATSGTPTTNYTVTLYADPTSGGTVTGGGTYKEGSTATVKATPNSGYTFDDWYENGVAKLWADECSFSVYSNRTLTAKFNSSGGSGGGTTSGTTKVKVSGVDATSSDVVFINQTGTTEVNITPSSRCTIYAYATGRTISRVELYTDGTYLGDVNLSGFLTSTADGDIFEYGFVAGTESAGHTTEFKVHFSGGSSGGSSGGTGEEFLMTVSTNNASYGTVTVTVNGTQQSPASDYTNSYKIRVGDTVTLQAIPSAGHSFSMWSNGTSILPSGATHTFTATTADVNFAAYFN